MPHTKKHPATVRIPFAQSSNTVRGLVRDSDPRPSDLRKLTVHILEKLSPDDIVRDSVVRGMFAESSKRGVVSLKVQADLRRGIRNGVARKRESIRMTLGRFPDMTLDAARAEAMRLLAEIKAGRDPRPTAAPSVPVSTVWTIEHTFTEYEADLKTREKAVRTIADMRRLLGYLDDWRALPINAVTKEMARARHQYITQNNGPVVANQVLKALRTCFNFAGKVLTAPLGANPVKAVTFNRERSANRAITLEDLGDWHRKVQTLPNPSRRLMHEIGLFTGLRPSNLAGMERNWIDFERLAIVIPAHQYKGRFEFHLPLSGHIVGLLQRALVLSRELESDAPWVFPSRSRDGHRVIPTQVWKESNLPTETGHMLRHTYSNATRLAGVEDVDRELLLGHKIPGVQGTYLHAPALFGRLREQQEKVTAHLLKAIGTPKRAKGAGKGAAL